MIDLLKIEITQLKNHIDQLIEESSILKTNRALLKSIKGIGDVMARELVYLFASKQFKNAKQATAFLGLTPKITESGVFKVRPSLNKIGPSRMRAKLYLAAVAASRFNPDIKAQKHRLSNNGKTKMQALGAAMRKLI
jgi:transposase